MESKGLLVKQIETGVRSKWSWLELEAAMDIKGAAHTFPLSDCFKEVDTPGHAKCILCVKVIN